MDERRCAELIAEVRRQGKVELGVYFVVPGTYTREEIRVAQASCDRLGLGWQIGVGGISMGEPTTLQFVK